MNAEQSLASLYQSAAGESPSAAVLASLLSDYTGAVALCEPPDPAQIDVTLGELAAALAGRAPLSGPVDPQGLNALSEFFPRFARALGLSYEDYGEWARLELPAAGLLLHLSREGDTYQVLQRPM